MAPQIVKLLRLWNLMAVGGGCWRQNALATIFGNWWPILDAQSWMEDWMLTLLIVFENNQHNANRRQHIDSVTNITNIIVGFDGQYYYYRTSLCTGSLTGFRWNDKSSLPETRLKISGDKLSTKKILITVWDISQKLKNSKKTRSPDFLAEIPF